MLSVTLWWIHCNFIARFLHILRKQGTQGTPAYSYPLGNYIESFSCGNSRLDDEYDGCQWDMSYN